MASLPSTLRQQLGAALEQADSERISTLIEQVALIDAELAGALSRLAKGFDYAAILRLLDEAGG